MKKEKLMKNKKLVEIKRAYVEHENMVEEVTDKGVKEGLGELFDYINKDEKIKDYDLLVVLLLMHQKLYSKAKFPEFGGKFRNINTYIEGAKVETSDYNDITKDILEISKDYKDLLLLSKEVNKNKSLYKKYINKVIDLKCRLVEIHPFTDGNGRTCRALVNLLLKQVDVLPVYVKIDEKEIYIDSMNDALVNKEKDKIYKFYHDKIKIK